jgi:hypothetical protein
MHCIISRDVCWCFSDWNLTNYRTSATLGIKESKYFFFIGACSFDYICFFSILLYEVNDRPVISRTFCESVEVE